MASSLSLDSIGEILYRAKTAAVEYYQLTGKPLGITGEIGEYEAARLLDLELTDAREPGHDAIDANGRRYQIKTRALSPQALRKSQSIGCIKLHHGWDSVLLVILNISFDPLEIWEAERTPITQALTAPGSKARNERGALPISKFKSIGSIRWKAM